MSELLSKEEIDKINKEYKEEMGIKDLVITPDTPIDDCEFSIRTLKVLKYFNFTIVKDLTDMKVIDYIKLRIKAGKAVEEEISNFLSEHIKELTNEDIEPLGW